MKIVINKCFGGFGLSHVAVMRYAELKGFVLHPYLDGITREIYKDRAVIGNPELLHHYSRTPVEGLPVGKWGLDLPVGSSFDPSEIARNDSTLIQVVEELGEAADGQYAKLRIVEIPDGVEYEIDEYDGREYIAEVHRIWR
jgi:hypothetical protein